jgi:hypothetical protein
MKFLSAIARKIWRFFREVFSHLELVVTSLVISAVLLQIPFQHYIPLARIQHRSFGGFAVAAGLLLQSVFSWRRVSFWGKLALAGGAAYVLAFALVQYNNPWLGSDAPESYVQAEFRRFLEAFRVTAGVPLLAVWVVWLLDKRADNQAQATKKVS